MCSDRVLFNNKAGYLERRLQLQIPEAGAFTELLFVLFVGLELLLIEILEAGAGAFTELLFVRLELLLVQIPEAGDLQCYILLGWSFYYMSMDRMITPIHFNYSQKKED